MTTKSGAEIPDLQRLNKAERRVVEAAARGKVCHLGEGFPSAGADWPESRTVRAEVVYALCCGTRADWPVHPRGVKIDGARIRGKLDFDGATLRAPLWLTSCSLEERLGLERSRGSLIVLSGSHMPGVRAEDLRLDHSLLLDDGFSATDGVDLTGATIGGDLNCHAGRFEPPSGDAILANLLQCRGDVFLTAGFFATGAVHLMGAEIGGNLNCNGGGLDCPGREALLADRLVCKGNVNLSFWQEEGVRCPFTARGGVRLAAAKIGGDLDCEEARLENPGGDALMAQGLRCGGSVFLRRRYVETEDEPGMPVAEAAGGGFSAQGGVRLEGARIQGHLFCVGARLVNRGDPSMAAGEGVTDILELLFGDEAPPTALGLAGVRATSIQLYELPAPPDGLVNLSDANVDSYVDDQQSWPEPGRLLIDGFRYSAIHSLDPEPRPRQEWLQLAPEFRNQPYSQLASVFKAHGKPEGARETLIAQQRERLRSGQEPFRVRLWLWLLGSTLGFGYKPSRALWALLGLLLFGWWLFDRAHSHGLMAPTNPLVMVSESWVEQRELAREHRDYPRFQALVYSVDALVPVVQLGMDAHWHPTAGFAWWYLRLHIAAGWILSTLAALGFSGVVRPV